MFGPPPADYVTSAAERDLRERMVPSHAQLDQAAEMLAANPGAYAVIVPIAFPGKAHGIWTVGQPVAHPPGAWLAVDQSDGYRRARDAADMIARAWIEQHGGGTSGHVVIHADGTAAVFEDF